MKISASQQTNRVRVIYRQKTGDKKTLTLFVLVLPCLLTLLQGLNLAALGTDPERRSLFGTLIHSVRAKTERPDLGHISISRVGQISISANTMTYTKPWKNASDQLDLLVSRGLAIDDRDKARACLERIGYYRLSGYWFAFRERSNEVCLFPKKTKNPGKVQTVALDLFKDAASFQNALDLYVFDKQLRLLTMDALERIEIAMRVDISHMLGEFDRFAYLRSDLFHAKFTEEFNPKTGTTPHHEWLSSHARLVKRSREDFVEHNKEKYGLPLAIWVACEVWDFGTMSKLFDGMQEQHQDKIALKYGIKNGRTFATWLRSLGYLRNVCAHHCRLWNRNMVSQPKLPPKEEVDWVTHFQSYTHGQSRCYMLLVMTGHLIEVINPNSSRKQRARQHLTTFPDLAHLGLNLKGMGAVDGWDAFE